MARITVTIDLESLAHFLDREVPAGARPAYAEISGGSVVIRYAMGDDSEVDFDELRLYLDFSDWQGKVVDVRKEYHRSGTFDAHSVYAENVGKIHENMVWLTVDGPPVKEEQAAKMQKELREAFREAKAIVVTIPGIGMRRIE